MTRSTRLKDHSLMIRLERNDQVVHEGRLEDLQLPLVIGRQPGCAWQVPAEETSVSKTHAEITVRHGHAWIRDLGSRNGLFVLGRKVSERRLEAGMSVSLGQCRLTVERIDERNAARILPYHRLEWLNGEKAGTFCDITSAVLPIGSAVADGILCSSVLVSKRHAEIQHEQDDSCWIQDLGSRNGTMVNGVPLKKAKRMLRHRDVISVADVQFRFWDRTVDPTRSRLLLKLCVALVTAAVVGTGYFAVQTIFPSAKAKLAEACEWESRENFARATAALDQALSARGADDYRDEIERKRGELLIWRNTLEVWRSAKEDFGRRFWIDASTKLGSLLNANVEKWGWNTTTAQTMKREARLMKDLVDVFLTARSAIRGDFRESERGHEREALVARLAAVERALADPRWTADLPTGKLRADMEEQRTELKALIADLGEVAALLAAIRVPEEADLKTAVQLAGTFPQTVRKLEGLGRRAQEREVRRAQAAKKEGRNFAAPRIVSEACDEFIPVLARFGEAQAVLNSNLVYLVSCRYDAMREDLPFPSDQQCSLMPQLGELRRLMAAANRRLNDDVREAMRDQLARLGKWNLESGKAPAAVAPLLDAGTCEKVFACDSLRGRRPKSSRTECVGKYDEVLGIEAFADYLKSFDVDRDYHAAYGEVRGEPVLVEALRFYRQADQFLRFLDNADIAYLLTVDAPDGNRLRAVADMVISLQEKRELLIDAWWNRESDDRRSCIIARGLAWALDTNGRLGAEAGAELRRDLAGLKAVLAALKAKIDANPDCVTEVRPQILKIGIPGLYNVNAWWDQEAKRKERAR